MAQVADNFPGKHQAQSSIFSTAKERNKEKITPILYVKKTDVRLVTIE
jgi:hypothetical protein